MVAGGMMLGEVISLVVASRLPIDVKLALPDAIADPVKPHVDCLGTLLFDGVIGNAGSGTVVGLDGCGWLWVAKLFQCRTNRACILSVEEETS